MNKLILPSFALLALIIISKIKSVDDLQHNKAEWTKYTVSKKIVKKSHTTQEEVERLKISIDNHITRAPAAVGNTSALTPIERYGRTLTGENIENYKDLKVPLTFINTFNPKWGDILGQELLRFMPNETHAFFKKEGSFIKMRGGKGQFIEKVIITYLSPDGKKSSFNASIDSQTGKILETWNRTIFEKDPRNEIKIKATGGIR